MNPNRETQNAQPGAEMDWAKPCRFRKAVFDR